MNPTEYQRAAMRTNAPATSAMCILGREDSIAHLNHAMLGMTSELGELADALKKYLHYGRDFDRVNALEELGDIAWYLALAVDCLGGDLENVLEANIAKLKKRFPEKFGDNGAEHRDVQQERMVLEENLKEPQVTYDPFANENRDQKGTVRGFDEHYAKKAIEPIAVIEQIMGNENMPAQSRYHVGNAIKYLMRAGSKKGEAYEKDLEKALNYIHRALYGRWLDR